MITIHHSGFPLLSNVSIPRGALRRMKAARVSQSEYINSGAGRCSEAFRLSPSQTVNCCALQPLTERHVHPIVAAVKTNMSRTRLIFERVLDRELSIDLVVDAACWSGPEIEIARVRFDRIALRGADADASASEECS